MTTFADRLHGAVQRTENPTVVGLDPHLHLLPEEFAVARDATAPRAERADAIARFLFGIIDVASGRVPAVKPQSAFFEALGADGVDAFERVVARSREAGLLVIGDVKRGDIGSTAKAYADAFLRAENETFRCDAVTLNPYLGTDSLAPFVDACREVDAGAYVLVRTSNPSSAELQTLTDADGVKLSDRAADLVVRLGEDIVGSCGWSSIGAVVGATHPAELAALRARMPKTPFLIPGFGAQGGGAADVAPAFEGTGLMGGLVNSSRGILFAGQSDPSTHWKDAASAAIDVMAKELREVAVAANP